jgi:hypothetical protein
MNIINKTIASLSLLSLYLVALLIGDIYDFGGWYAGVSTSVFIITILRNIKK